MANKFQLIDVIDESSKITQKNLNGLFSMMERTETNTRKTLGIKEMFDDFDAGSDPGEDEDDFRHAAGQGEFDDEDDMEGMDDELGGEDELGAEDEHGGLGDELDAMGDEGGMGDEFGGEEEHGMDDELGGEDELDFGDGEDELGHGDASEFDDEDMDDMDEPDEFDSEGGDKFDADEFMGRMEGKESLLQTIARQVNEMGGKSSTPKKVLPKRHDHVVYETSGRFIHGRVKNSNAKKVLVKFNESERVIGMKNIIPGIKSKDENFRAKVKGFKANHPSHNVWVVQL